MSLTGLRFVESIFRTAGGRKISIDQSVEGSEEDDFEESVIINNKIEEESDESEKVKFSSNERKIEGIKKDLLKNSSLDEV